MSNPDKARPKFEDALQRLVLEYKDIPTEDIVHALDSLVLVLEKGIEREKTKSSNRRP